MKSDQESLNLTFPEIVNKFNMDESLVEPSSESDNNQKIIERQNYRTNKNFYKIYTCKTS